ncbi:MAG: hypothetical protein VX293_06160, partial [Candidatus Latescibacterota bacterium]|nr:hypothetical protein [Candidatus Latescibacterota bacterium]
MTRQEIADAVARLLGTEVRRFDFINGGRNNRVGRVSSDGGEFAVKAYFRDPRDRRTRLRAEYSMLEFLWRCGVRCIPEPLAVDRDLDIAVYRFVEGERPVAEALDAADTGALAALLGTMWALRGEAGAGALDTASEACFSVADYVDVVTRRRQRVVSHLGEELDDTRARAFLDGPFFRVLAEARTNAEAAADDAAALPPDAWTLSPSD